MLETISLVVIYIINAHPNQRNTKLLAALCRVIHQERLNESAGDVANPVFRYISNVKLHFFEMSETVLSVVLNASKKAQYLVRF